MLNEVYGGQTMTFLSLCLLLSYYIPKAYYYFLEACASIRMQAAQWMFRLFLGLCVCVF